MNTVTVDRQALLDLITACAIASQDRSKTVMDIIELASIVVANSAGFTNDQIANNLRVRMHAAVPGRADA